VIFPLELNIFQFPKPALNEEYLLCLDANDEAVLPLNSIETGLSANDFSFMWYRGNEAIAANIIPGETSPSYFYSAEGDYTIRIISLITNCEMVFTVAVNASSPPDSLTAEVTSQPFSGNNEINAVVEGNGNYLYSLNGGDPQSSGNFQNVAAGTHIITAFDEFGCGSISKEVIVLDYPRFFTPNGDGVNDLWDISAFASLVNLQIRIFDKYGKLLKILNEREFGWDGFYNGSTMPANDYWFSATFSEDNIVKEVKGHFTLKR